MQAVVQLIKGLGCEVIAEAVETVAQADILRAMGCDAVQGYVFAPPMFEEEFLAWTRKGQFGETEIGRLAKHLSDDPFIDLRQGQNVIHRGAFAHLVHRGVGQAKVDHRA